MMYNTWTRAELKSRAKIAFRRNYWKCVLVALILSLLTGGNASNSATDSMTNDSYQTTENYYIDENGAFVEDDDYFIGDVISDAIGIVTKGLSFTVIFVIGLISILLTIFIFNVLEVGGAGFFLTNTYTVADASEIFSGFREGRYWRSVSTIFFRNLYIALWSLLLVIPGIIKAYEYRMIPYLLAEYPNMTKEEAFRMSKEMMRGEKWNTFILDLSFIGWIIVGAVTLGIGGVFYVAPYQHATNAELYVTLRNRYYYSGETVNY